MSRTIKNNLTMVGRNTVDPYTAVDAYDEMGRRWTIGPNQRLNTRDNALSDTLLGNASGIQSLGVLSFVKVADGLDTKTLIT